MTGARKLVEVQALIGSEQMGDGKTPSSYRGRQMREPALQPARRVCALSEDEGLCGPLEDDGWDEAYWMELPRQGSTHHAKA